MIKLIICCAINEEVYIRKKRLLVLLDKKKMVKKNSVEGLNQSVEAQPNPSVIRTCDR